MQVCVYEIRKREKEKRREREIKRKEERERQRLNDGKLKRKALVFKFKKKLLENVSGTIFLHDKVRACSSACSLAPRVLTTLVLKHAQPPSMTTATPLYPAHQPRAVK